MEPDIRIKTNELGFCKSHFDKMLAMRKSLPVALIMESHLKHIKDGIMSQKSSKKRVSEISKLTHTCYVCEKIDWSLNTMMDTVCRLWKENDGFREMYTSQDHICLYHYDKITSMSTKLLKRGDLKSFEDATLSLTSNYLDTLCSDVSHFCEMYNYKNSSGDSDWGNSKDSVDRAVKFLNRK